MAEKVQRLISFVAFEMGKHELVRGIKIKNPLIGRQENKMDCGVFIAQYGRCIGKREQTTFGQDDMDYFRMRMAIELMDGKLLD